MVSRIRSLVYLGLPSHTCVIMIVIIQTFRSNIFCSPITTYSSQGCLKRGCVPSEHSVVYMRGTRPTIFEGEIAAGLTKDPIEVIPASPDVTLKSASRLHYAKPYPIEMNIKVKDIGNVCPEQLSLLVSYYNQENNMAVPMDPSVYSSPENPNGLPLTASSESPMTSTQPAPISMTSFSGDRTDDLPPSKSRIDGAADTDRMVGLGMR